MLIDTHCHLDAAEFDADRDAVAQRAVAAGVERIVVPAISRANFAAVLDTCARYPCCRPALGLHPMLVAEHSEADLQDLRAAIEAHRPLAVGEIGLDLFVPDADAARQAFFFAEQLKIARDYDLPVLLHIRRAQDQVLKHVRRIPVKGGIAHAFNGSRQQADEFIKLGFKLGFGGAMTYPRATRLRALAAELPLEAIVLETDAPDIPPVFAARQRNSPEYLAQIAETLAGLRGLTLAEIALATGRNAQAVLGLTD
ncbi:MAG: TatD family hydrolase [Sulfuricellaceae bacterium]|nr:TatD family hydrolase [Sulfuricellaceae bacterium]